MESRDLCRVSLNLEKMKDVQRFLKVSLQSDKFENKRRLATGCYLFSLIVYSGFDGLFNRFDGFF